MAGVIDRQGIQWEHCNKCGQWESIGNLRYEKPSEQFRYGRDLCRKCAPHQAASGAAAVIKLR